MSDTFPEIAGFVIKRSLAMGGMAEVFLAEQQSLSRDVAIKVMDGHVGDKAFTERFLQEAKLVAALKHPHIITIYDFGVLEDGRLYLVMEYVEGGDLEARIEQGLDEQESLSITQQVAQALAFVHSKNIVHRDIKPANILFRADGSVVLTDFGIAKQENNDISLTRTGTTVGSPAYCSPEQAQGLELDLRTDMYSLGVVLVEMLTGVNPFKADTFMNTSINHIQMPVPVLSNRHKRYQTLLNQMLAKEKQDRFSSMDVLLEHLQKGSVAKKLSSTVADTETKDFSLLFSRTLAWLAMTVVVLMLVTQVVDFSGQRAEANAILQKAEERMQNRYYVFPSDNNALLYYQQVLALDPGNDDAQAGIEKIVDYYLRQAKEAKAKNSLGNLRKNIERGLLADPNNAELLTLQAELAKNKENNNVIKSLGTALDNLFN